MAVVANDVSEAVRDEFQGSVIRVCLGVHRYQYRLDRLR